MNLVDRLVRERERQERAAEAPGVGTIDRAMYEAAAEAYNHAAILAKTTPPEEAA